MLNYCIFRNFLKKFLKIFYSFLKISNKLCLSWRRKKLPHVFLTFLLSSCATPRIGSDTLGLPVPPPTQLSTQMARVQRCRRSIVFFVAFSIIFYDEAAQHNYIYCQHVQDASDLGRCFLPKFVLHDRTISCQNPACWHSFAFHKRTYLH